MQWPGRHPTVALHDLTPESLELHAALRDEHPPLSVFLWEQKEVTWWKKANPISSSQHYCRVQRQDSYATRSYFEVHFSFSKKRNLQLPSVQEGKSLLSFYVCQRLEGQLLTEQLCSLLFQLSLTSPPSTGDLCRTASDCVRRLARDIFYTECRVYTESHSCIYRVHGCKANQTLPDIDKADPLYTTHFSKLIASIAGGIYERLFYRRTYNVTNAWKPGAGTSALGSAVKAKHGKSRQLSRQVPCQHIDNHHK